jgi:hypothetical protein
MYVQKEQTVRDSRETKGKHSQYKANDWQTFVESNTHYFTKLCKTFVKYCSSVSETEEDSDRSERFKTIMPERKVGQKTNKYVCMYVCM